MVKSYSLCWKLNCCSKPLDSHDTGFAVPSDQNVPSSARQSVMSERSGGTPPYHSSPRPSLSQSHSRLPHQHSHNAVPHEGERLSFSLHDTFRELDEFQEDPPLFMEENSWEGQDSEHSDPTLTLLNCSHFQVSHLFLRKNH